MRLLERGRAGPAQVDVEVVCGRPVGHGVVDREAGDHALARGRITRRIKNRVVREERVAREVHLRNQPLRERPPEQRLVTQMYFPGDPFFPYDPIFNSARDPAARERMISSFSIHDTVPDWAAAYHFDIYLRGPGATPFEEAH